MIWVIAAVALAELLKNVVYEPVVLGGAVNLHPLVVVVGVVGGAILFGPVGMLLAIPTITVVKVLVSSRPGSSKPTGWSEGDARNCPMRLVPPAGD